MLVAVSLKFVFEGIILRGAGNLMERSALRVDSSWGTKCTRVRPAVSPSLLSLMGVRGRVELAKGTFGGVKTRGNSENGEVL